MQVSVKSWIAESRFHWNEAKIRGMWRNPLTFIFYLYYSTLLNFCQSLLSKKVSVYADLGCLSLYLKSDEPKQKRQSKAICFLCLNSVLGSYSAFLFTPFLHQFTIEIRGVMWCYVVLTIPNKPCIIQEKLTFVVKYRETWNYSLYFDS